KGKESQQPLHIGGRTEAKTEVGWQCEKVQASRRNQRAENRRAKAEETRREKHRRQQERKEMAVQQGGKSPETDCDPHRKRGSSILHQRRIAIPRDPTLQIGPNSRHLRDCRFQLAVLNQGGKAAFDALGNSSSRK